MIKKLQWDSDFFGYPVGILKAGDYADVDRKRFLAEAKEYRLVTLFFDHPIPRKPAYFKLVDKKVVFRRKTEKLRQQPGPGSGGISRFRGRANRTLFRLALESGSYSRYRTDDGFRNGEFRRLYRKWLDNSLSGVSAKATYVYRIGERTAGFITLRAEGKTAAIGLLAVDGRDRGKGIGTALIGHAVRKAFDFGCTAITVATQLDNDPAVRLYLKNGFRIKDVKMIYHYRVDR
jgi:dTDP-4-amino-4,6-dideoxy-D-galactose acyltransferase